MVDVTTTITPPSTTNKDKDEKGRAKEIIVTEEGKGEVQGEDTLTPIHTLLQQVVERYRPDGTASTSYRSFEHVLQSRSCTTNRYLYRLIYGTEGWAKQFIHLLGTDKRWANMACMKTKHLKKELVESVSMIERVERIIGHKLGNGANDTTIRNDDARISAGENILLLDLCSGKGVAGTMLAIRFPEARVIGIDIRPPSTTEHHLRDGFLPNLTRITGNLYDDKLLDELVTQSSPSLSMMAKEGGEGEDGTTRRVVLVGTHLCGDLSRVAIDLMASYPQHIVAAIIAPCCLPRRKAPTGSWKFSGNSWGYDTTHLARQQGMNPFALWLDRLYERAPTQYRCLFRDDDMLSPKNTYLLLCHRMGPFLRGEQSEEGEQKQRFCQDVQSCSE